MITIDKLKEFEGYRGNYDKFYNEKIKTQTNINARGEWAFIVNMIKSLKEIRAGVATKSWTVHINNLLKEHFENESTREYLEEVSKVLWPIDYEFMYDKKSSYDKLDSQDPGIVDIYYNTYKEKFIQYERYEGVAELERLLFEQKSYSAAQVFVMDVCSQENIKRRKDVDEAFGGFWW